MKKNKTDRKSDWEKDFVERLTKWYQNQTGWCACLGNCERCGHHLCHGCACWILDEVENLLSKQREQMVEEMQDMAHDIVDNRNNALSAQEKDWHEGQLHLVKYLINKLNKLGDE